MLARTGFILLILGTSQVLSDYIPVDYVENQKDNDAQRGSRIVSGWPAKLGQFPHQAAVRMLAANGLVSSCGGSVVHSSWVLTAAHCTAQQMQLVIITGVVNLLMQPAQSQETSEWYLHPSFDSERPRVVQPNDVSLVRMHSEIRYSILVQPIRIQSSLEASLSYANAMLVASGFGATWTAGPASDQLNWVYLRGVDNAECARIFGTALITPSAICAQYYNVTSQSICQGDSGGPLMQVSADGSPTLVGISSFVAGGDFGCHSVHPGGFIRPGAFHPWYKQVTGIDFENLDENNPTDPPTIATTEPPTEPPIRPPPRPTTVPPTEPPTNPPTEPPTNPPTEPPTNPPTEPPTEAETEPQPRPTTSAPAPTTAAPPTTTALPEQESEESTEKPGTEEDSSSSEEDPELKDLLKRLEVMVNVKVKLDKYKSKHNIHEVVHQ